MNKADIFGVTQKYPLYAPKRAIGKESGGSFFKNAINYARK